MSEPGLIPRPAAVETGYGDLRVSDHTTVLAGVESAGAAALLAYRLPPVDGAPRPVGY